MPRLIVVTDSQGSAHTLRFVSDEDAVSALNAVLSGFRVKKCDPHPSVVCLELSVQTGEEKPVLSEIEELLSSSKIVVAHGPDRMVFIFPMTGGCPTIVFSEKGKES